MNYKHDSGSALSVASSSGPLFEAVPAAGKRLHIQAKGMGLIRVPMPMMQNEIPIYGEDGSLIYVAKKDRTWSRRWVLSSAKQGPLVSIECLPGSRPCLRRLDSGTGNEVSSIGLRGKWTSRAVTFAAAGGSGTLEWKYAKTKMADGKNLTTLRLEQTEEREGLLHTRPVAHLLRREQPCLSGRARQATGHGGELILEPEARTGAADEALVVASCLVMLRRERDRRRFVQAMVIGAGGS